MLNLFLKIRPFIKDFFTVLSLVKALILGKYKGVSGKTVMAIVLGAVYLFSPIDFIPDFFSIFGFADDITVLGAITLLIRDDLEKFREWKKSESLK